jgi:hypothetical protein
MANEKKNIICFEDGVNVEIDATDAEQPRNAAAGSAAKIQRRFEAVLPTITAICTPLTNVWKELSKDVTMHEAEVELGISFDLEGNIYIAKSQVSTNLKVTFKFSPVNDVKSIRP